jgi:hypothetical protein
MAYGTINAEQLTTQSGYTLGAGNSSSFKNRLINSGMVIDQRNAGASVTPTNGSYTYIVDRWKAFQNQASKFTVQQNAGSVTPPVGFSNYLGATSSSAYSVTSGDIFMLNQIVEGFNIADLGWGTANAKTITLSFQVYSSLTGTFGGSLTNYSGTSYSYPFTYSIPTANTWTTISVTIAGPTVGVWSSNNNGGIQLSFSLGVGSTYSGTAGSWTANNYFSATGATSVVGTNGATFYITGVQLEVGTVATSFDYRDYGRELLMCQRYFAKLTSDGSGADVVMGMGMQQSTTTAFFYIKYPTTMRAEPTATISGMAVGNQINFTNAATLTLLSPAYDTASLNVSYAAAGAGQLPICLLSQSGVAGSISLSSEL